ncbi:serine/threonine-protein kinase [Actinomadura fibrosa]|uniref:Protein kinase n=1 Tax=Actinomadura fibrosa TaxID=111802 RepID=A0ABW2Y2Z3_9ACTN|nr:serine/threonine-protein kinase [Actinomadura fibrosa]
MAPRPLLPGDPDRLGRYELLGRLGEGGQSIVYLGRCPDGGQAAVKLLRAGFSDQPEWRARFERERKVIGRVAGFCTARVLDADVSGEPPYVVSEYVPGPSLTGLVTGQGPRTGTDLERLAVGTITALTAIHRAGILHRDFKPSNVLMGPDGPRVIDFGIARALGSAARKSGSVVGTPSYMAPEQVADGDLGAGVDLFAWGATILFAATGRHPFGNDTLSAVFHRILYCDPDLSPLPGSLRDTVASCLAKDPGERPEAQQVLLDLLGRQIPLTPEEERALSTDAHPTVQDPLPAPPPAATLAPPATHSPSASSSAAHTFPVSAQADSSVSPPVATSSAATPASPITHAPFASPPAGAPATAVPASASAAMLAAPVTHAASAASSAAHTFPASAQAGSSGSPPVATPASSSAAMPGLVDPVAAFACSGSGGGQARPRWGRRRIVVVMVPVVLLAAAGTAWRVASSGSPAELASADQRPVAVPPPDAVEAVGPAAEAIRAVLTIGHASLERNASAAHRLATSRYGAEYDRQLATPGYLDELRARDGSVAADVIDSAVVTAVPGRVTVLAYVRRTVRARDAGPERLHDPMRATMVREGSGWLLDSLAMLKAGSAGADTTGAAWPDAAARGVMDAVAGDPRIGSGTPVEVGLRSGAADRITALAAVGACAKGTCTDRDGITVRRLVLGRVGGVWRITGSERL